MNTCKKAAAVARTCIRFCGTMELAGKSASSLHDLKACYLERSVSGHDSTIIASPEGPWQCFWHAVVEDVNLDLFLLGLSGTPQTQALFSPHFSHRQHRQHSISHAVKDAVMLYRIDCIPRSCDLRSL